MSEEKVAAIREHFQKSWQLRWRAVIAQAAWAQLDVHLWLFALRSDIYRSRANISLMNLS